MRGRKSRVFWMHSLIPMFQNMSAEPQPAPAHRNTLRCAWFVAQSTAAGHDHP
jgi:hypothetical protein